MNSGGIQRTDSVIRSETKLELKWLYELLGSGCLIGIRYSWPAIGVAPVPISNSTEYNFVVVTVNHKCMGPRLIIWLN